MWAAAAYAAGCRGTGPVAICAQARRGCGGCCSRGSASLLFPGPCIPAFPRAVHEAVAGHLSQSWEPAVVCPELFASHENFFSFGLQ